MVTSTLVCNTILGENQEVIVIIPEHGMISAYLAKNSDVIVQVDQVAEVIPAIQTAAKDYKHDGITGDN